MKKFLLFILLFIPLNVFAKTEAIVDITTLSIKEIQEYVDKGYLSYEQIMGIYLDRIEEYNDQYNAIITVNENALEEAKKLDEEYKNTGRRSLIHGLPIIVKDNIDVKGLPTTNGTKALLDSYPYENAPVVQKLVDAGAIVIAKTNMDEFAFNAYYSRSSFGFVHNAYDTDYSSYGSSGGTAVGVAASLAVAGLGTDTGSSIRVPSAANGIVGLRPTYGLLNTDGIIKFESLRDVVGPITKYVEDNAIMLEIMSGSNYQDNLNKSLKGIRIGVLNREVNRSSSFIQEMIRENIRKLEDSGAEIVYLDSIYLNYEFDATNMCYEFNEYLKGTNSSIRSLDDLIHDGRYIQYIDGYSGYYCNHDYKETSYYKNYLTNRESNIKKANNFYDNNNVDVVIYPSLYYKTLLLSDIYTGTLQTFASSFAPLVGFPSMAVHTGFHNGMPYGMEIVARPNKENVLYQIASNLEKTNNYYQLPDIAPNLYEEIPNIDKLLTYYNEEKNEPEYLEAKEKAKDFLIHISDYEDKDSKIDELVKLYEEVPNKINERKEQEKEEQKKDILPVIIIAIFIIIIVIKVLGGKHEKIKRANRNKPRSRSQRYQK